MAEYGIISSGDPAKDRADLERHALFDERIKIGICPNGCAPLEWHAGGFTADCKSCNFQYSTNTPFGGLETGETIQ